MHAECTPKLADAGEISIPFTEYWLQHTIYSVKRQNLVTLFIDHTNKTEFPYADLRSNNDSALDEFTNILLKVYYSFGFRAVI